MIILNSHWNSCRLKSYPPSLWSGEWKFLFALISIRIWFYYISTLILPQKAKLIVISLYFFCSTEHSISMVIGAPVNGFSVTSSLFSVCLCVCNIFSNFEITILELWWPSWILSKVHIIAILTASRLKFTF